MLDYLTVAVLNNQNKVEHIQDLKDVEHEVMPVILFLFNQVWNQRLPYQMRRIQ